jgi:hypothetical protein
MWKQINNMALLEIRCAAAAQIRTTEASVMGAYTYPPIKRCNGAHRRCKLGSMKQNLAETRSIGDAFFIVQSFRALERVRSLPTMAFCFVWFRLASGVEY